MEVSQLELEKLKMQRVQMYLQVASLFLSGIFIYTLLAGKNKIKTVSNPEDDIELDDIFED